MIFGSVVVRHVEIIDGILIWAQVSVEEIDGGGVLVRGRVSIEEIDGGVVLLIIGVRNVEIIDRSGFVVIAD